jgi:ketosteroid isomerase-like protein
MRFSLITGAALVATVGTISLLIAAKEQPTRPPTVTTLWQFMDAFNRHDLDAVMSFFADDCTLYMPQGPNPWGQKYVGKEDVRKGLATRFEGMPDVHYDHDMLWACGNRGLSKWTLTGTTKAGAHVEVRGCDLLEFRDGKVIEKDSYWKIVEK